MAKSSRQKAASHKRGDKRNEMAMKHRKTVGNFKQSKDVREDRGRRQTKLGGPKQGSFGRR
ncbi:MAG TPA: hypothetical protein VLJ37_04040 [bacterium]|nr:hypothetical protein [bacterium]